ncbi:MAG: hypothetical protein ABFS10_01825 [Bacteroidota bacterium]
MLKFKSTLLLSILFTLSAYSQDQLVIDDRSGILNDELEQLITAKLVEENIVYTTTLDYTNRCNYHFTKIQLAEEDLVVSVTDCNEKLLGSKILGSRILSSPSQEQGLLISYAILDIVSAPGKYVAPPTAGSPQPATGAVPVVVRTDSAITSDHNTRYFFAPSAYNLKKGELYYNTVYFLLHDIQYGVDDNFSIGIGTSVIGIPIYLTPKVSFPIGKSSSIAIGDMLLFGTWGSNAIGNLAYASFSTGGPNGNISLGGGHLYTNESEITRKTSSLVTNFSAMARVSPYIYFLTENYVLGVNINRGAYYYNEHDPNNYDDNEYYNEDYSQRSIFWYGIAGIRIVTKSRDWISWQAGLTYVANFPGEIPDKYTIGANSQYWDTNARTDFNIIAFPTVSFTVKFGRKF